MAGFVIERFTDGIMQKVETFFLGRQRLLNERDLDRMCGDKMISFVRRETDVNSGYYVADDGRWEYGTREAAESTIKCRL